MMETKYSKRSIRQHIYRNCNIKLNLIMVGVILLLGVVSGCNKNDPNEDPILDPVIKNPTITAIDPVSGTVGTEVAITGTNFSGTTGENVVAFNDMISTVKSSSSTQLVTTVPDKAKSGSISVTVNGKKRKVLHLP